jgi:hypothetical protein
MKHIDLSDKSFELIVFSNRSLRQNLSYFMNVSDMGIHYHRLIEIERSIRRSMLENIFK